MNFENTNELIAHQTYLVCKWRQVGGFDNSNEYVISKIADERNQAPPKSCRRKSWETRNEFNSPQPPQRVCVRIEVDTRIACCWLTRGLRFEFDRTDVHAANYRRGNARRCHSPVGDLEGERNQCCDGYIGHAAVECLERQRLYRLGRLEWCVAAQRHHDHSPSDHRDQLHAGLHGIGRHDDSVSRRVCHATLWGIGHLERRAYDSQQRR